MTTDLQTDLQTHGSPGVSRRILHAHGIVPLYGPFIVAKLPVKSVVIASHGPGTRRPRTGRRKDDIETELIGRRFEEGDEDFIKRQRNRQLREVLPFISLSGKPVPWGKPWWEAPSP